MLFCPRGQKEYLICSFIVPCSVGNRARLIVGAEQIFVELRLTPKSTHELSTGSSPMRLDSKTT